MAASAVLSRFRGALVGALIGDCLGANFEGDMQIPINSVLQHFSAVKTYPRKKEGNNCTLWLAGNRTFRPFVSSPPGRFAPTRFALGRIQRFLLIQLKPKHRRYDVLTTHVTVCVCHAELNETFINQELH